MQVGVNVQLIQVIRVRGGAVTTQTAEGKRSPRTRVREHVPLSHVHPWFIPCWKSVERMQNENSRRPHYVFGDLFGAGFSEIIAGTFGGTAALRQLAG